MCSSVTWVTVQALVSWTVRQSWSGRWEQPVCSSAAAVQLWLCVEIRKDKASSSATSSQAGETSVHCDRLPFDTGTARLDSNSFGSQFQPEPELKARLHITDLNIWWYFLPQEKYYKVLGSNEKQAQMSRVKWCYMWFGLLTNHIIIVITLTATHLNI